VHSYIIRLLRPALPFLPPSAQLLPFVCGINEERTTARTTTVAVQGEKSGETTNIFSKYLLIKFSVPIGDQEIIMQRKFPWTVPFFLDSSLRRP